MRRYLANEIDSEIYYQVPKEILTNPAYKGLNSDARLLYAILKDRMKLSQKNGWFNEAGEVYLMYTRENLGELLGVSDKTLTKAFNLLKELKLIEEIRQGLGKPNLIFIGHLELQTLENTLNRKISGSANEEFTVQQPENFRPNKNYINNTNINNQSINQEKEMDGQTDINTTCNALPSERDALPEVEEILTSTDIHLYNPDKQMVIQAAIEDMYLSDEFAIKHHIPHSVMKSRLKKLNVDALDRTFRAIQMMQEDDDMQIKNMNGYFKKVLWNNLLEAKL